MGWELVTLGGSIYPKLLAWMNFTEPAALGGSSWEFLGPVCESRLFMATLLWCCRVFSLW